MKQLPQRTVLMLVTNCCAREIVRLHVGVANALASPSVKLIAVATDGHCCSFFSRLSDPAEERCQQHRQDVHEMFEGSPAEFVDLCGSSSDLVSPCDAFGAETIDAHRLKWMYQTHPLWNIVRASVARHCDWTNHPPSSKQLSNVEALVVQSYLASAYRYYSIFRSLFENHSPSHVLIFNGLFYQERVACEVAFDLGIKVVLTESSSFKNRRLFRRVYREDGIRESLAMRVPTDYVLRPEQKARLSKYLNNVYSGGGSWVRHRSSPQTTEDLRTLRSSGKRIALFLSQVPYDTVITEDRMINDLPTVLEEVIRTFCGLEGWHLLIRLHPAARDKGAHRDTLLLQLAGHPNKGQFSLISGFEVNTYALMDLASIGITISSQSGLEMVGKHKTVVVLGSAFYRENGATIDRQSDESVANAIYRGISHVVDEACATRADATVHYWIYKYLTPMYRKSGFLPSKSVSRMKKLFL